MADTAMTTALEMNNAFRAINTLALEAQGCASEVRHLIAAIDEAADDLGCRGEEIGSNELEAMDRIVVFCRLARDAARRAGNLGEQIEIASKPLRQAEISPPIREEETA